MSLLETSLLSLLDCIIFRKTLHHLIHLLPIIVQLNLTEMYSVTIFITRNAPFLQNSHAFLHSRFHISATREGNNPQLLPLTSWKDITTHAATPCFICPSVKSGHIITSSHRIRYALINGYEKTHVTENTTENVFILFLRLFGTLGTTVSNTLPLFPVRNPTYYLKFKTDEHILGLCFNETSEI